MDDELSYLIEREGLQLSSVQKRAVAAMIDEVLLSFLLMVILWDSFATAASVEEVIALTNTFLLEFMAIKILYQTFFIMQYGATAGKIVMKIRVIDHSTLTTPAFLNAFNRAVFRIISEMLFYLGFVWGMMDPYKRTWHDRSAKTLVVDA